MFAKVKLLIPVLFLVISLSVRSQEGLFISGKMKLEGGRLNGKMEILKNGKRVRILNMTGSGKFEQELELNANFLFVFSQEGYVTKKIEINTKINGTRTEEDEPFTPFPFHVTLFKQYEGVNFVIFNQPVGKIRYNPEIDDFDYDTDYTKSIQERIAAAEKEVEKKRKEEEKLAEELEKQKREQEKLALQEAEKRKKEEEELARQKEKEKKELLALELAAAKEKEKLAEEQANQREKEEKALLASELAEQKEREKLAEDQAEQVKKEERERLAQEEKERREKERLKEEQEKEKARKAAPPITQTTQISKEDPPTTPKKKYKPPPNPTTKRPVTGVVVLQSYTIGEMGYPNLNSYGYIHFGDGTGRREITKEQFEEYAKIYH